MTTAEKVQPRLKERYRNEIKDSLHKQFGYGNVMQIPTVTKVVVNMGVGEAARDAKSRHGYAEEDLGRKETAEQEQEQACETAGAHLAQARQTATSELAAWTARWATIGRGMPVSSIASPTFMKLGHTI